MNTTGRNIILIITLALAGIACDPDAPSMPGGAIRPVTSEVVPDAPNDSCSISSGMLQPNQSLSLTTSQSSVKYASGSIAVPTLVSFSVCTIDTGGTNIRPKTQVFGPISGTQFMVPVQVKLSKIDAGLPPAFPDNATVWVFRWNSTAVKWEQHQLGKVKGSGFEYSITRNGTYVLGLSDSVWSTAGTFTPVVGGSLDLLHSNLSASPASIVETTLVTFTITAIRPAGLANPLNRVYEFSSSKPTAFNSPATMRVAFADAGYGPEDVAPHLVKCYYFDAATNQWILIGTSYDLARKQFIVNVVPNSQYAFGRRTHS